MVGKFILASETNFDTLPYGRVGWFSSPAATGATQLAIIDARLFPGKGHDFHRHPGQEEMLFIVAGRIEQWIDQEMRILMPGDAAFIPGNVVHASFNVGDTESQLLAIFSPCVGVGFEAIDMTGETPWKGLRG
jgi:quercetin dioxygenase-like cupin family protein